MTLSISDVRFVFPSLEEYKTHDPDDYALRRSSGSDEWADSVIIKNAKASATVHFNRLNF